MSESRVHLRLYGGVQGVGFRVFAARAAQRLALGGWVRNCTDGAVEVEAAGPAPALGEFRRLLAEGPRYADVREVEALPPSDAPLPASFEIRTTGR